MDAGIVNFAVYENGSEYLGIASITLPDMNNKTFTVNGAGIPGDVQVPVTGHMDAMTATITFLDASKAAYKLSEQRVHQLDCRACHEGYNNAKGQLTYTGFKYILQVIPTTMTSGSLAPAASQGMSNTYAVLSRKDYLDGKLLLEYDPLNFKYVDSSGQDRLKTVKKLLGK